MRFAKAGFAIYCSLLFSACLSGRAVATSDESKLLPPLAMTQSNVARRLAGVERYNGGGSTPGFEIYVMHAADGSVASVHIGYRGDHDGNQRVDEVKINAGRDSTAVLSTAWIEAFERSYKYLPSAIPRSLLSDRAKSDGTKQSDKEVIEFHSMPALASLNNAWHYDGGWKRGACPNAGPTLVMLYSDDVNRDREIFSELIASCYELKF